MIVACKQIISEIGPKYGYLEPNKIANSHEMADPMTILRIRLIFSSIVKFILFTFSLLKETSGISLVFSTTIYAMDAEVSSQ